MSAKESSPNPLQDHISFPTFDLVVNHFTSELNRCKEDLCGGVASAIPAADVINKLQGMCKISERDIYPTGMMGIDIPVLLQKEKEKPQEKIVVFIAQDPLRNASDANLHNNEYCSHIFHNDDIIVGTTFALHMKDMLHKLSFFNDLVSELWNNSYDVYMTDLSKLYIQSLPIKKLWRNKQFKDDAVELLKEELSLLSKDYSIIKIIVSGQTIGKQWLGKKEVSDLFRLEINGKSTLIPHYVTPHITAARADEFTSNKYWNERWQKVTNTFKIEFITTILRTMSNINFRCTSSMI